MKDLYLFLFLSIISCATSNRCPNGGDIYPCRCLLVSGNNYQIECAGESVDDKTLESIASRIVSPNGRFYELYIHDTKLSNIAPNLFAQTVFTNIVIENNEGLKTVDPFAFKKGTTNNLVIRRNKSLEDLRIYELARYLEPTQTVAFDGNALEEIVPNAFTPLNPETNKLRNIYLDGNKIEKLHTDAFYGLPNVQLISLQYNEIEEVHPHALRFSEGTPRTITVKLNNNQNQEENIDRDAIIVPANVTLRIFLENNQLSHLPQYEFRYLETAGNQIYLSNNEINCDCGMVWLSELPSMEGVQGLTCKNFAHANFNTLTLAEYCP